MGDGAGEREDGLHLLIGREFSKRWCFRRGFGGVGEDLISPEAHLLLTLLLGREEKGICVDSVTIFLHSTGHQTCFPNSELSGRLDLRLVKMAEGSKSGVRNCWLVNIFLFSLIHLYDIIENWRTVREAVASTRIKVYMSGWLFWELRQMRNTVLNWAGQTLMTWITSEC